MIIKISKNHSRQKIHNRIRKKVMGSAERPRLNVYRSLNHIYAQLVDDLKGETMVQASTLEDAKAGSTATGNLASAKAVGTRLADRAKGKGVEKIVFDRGGYLYHGRVKALADAAREAGLKF